MKLAAKEARALEDHLAREAYLVMAQTTVERREQSNQI
jgi:hypothetical protein